MKKKEEVTITFMLQSGEFHDLENIQNAERWKRHIKSTRNIVEHLPICVRLLSFLFMIQNQFIQTWNIHYRCQYYNEHPLVNEAIRQVEQLQKQQEKKKHRDVAR